MLEVPKAILLWRGTIYDSKIWNSTL